MWEYVVRRVLFMFPILVGVLAFTFLISHIIPADPVGVYLGKQANNPELRANVTARYHLDEPLEVQFYYYMKGVFTGDLGYSFLYKEDVSEILAIRLPATIELITFAIIIAIPTGIFLGVVSATKRNTVWDAIARFVALLGISVPTFFLALAVQIIFVSSWNVFPLAGRFPNTKTPPPDITGLYTIDSILSLDIQDLVTSIYYIALPSFVLGFSIIGYILRMTRSSMLEVMSSDYVKAARAKGVPERRVVYGHALKNAMGPTLTIAGLTIGGAITYTVFVESIFVWPGIGEVAVEWTKEADFSGILGFTILVTLGFLVANLMVDILYVFIDPQVRLGGKSSYAG